MIELLYYVSEDGTSPFEDWFSGLDQTAGAKITIALSRLALGNLSSLKSVGEGVLECRIDWGPGYRVYLGRDGAIHLIMLNGGAAKTNWTDYKKRRKPN